MQTEQRDPWYRITAKGPEDGEIEIYDVISNFAGMNAQQFSKDLKAIGKVKNLAIHINSPGGDVFEGQAIYSQLKHHKAHKTVFIDGIAASIASVIAMAGDEVVMPENGMMMIHEPSGFVMGTQDDMAKMADVLAKIRETIVAVYARKTGLEREHVAEMMKEETWLTADEAVEFGFADRREEPVELAAHFDLSQFSNVPPSLAKKVNGAGTVIKEAVMAEKKAEVTEPTPEIKAERVSEMDVQGAVYDALKSERERISKITKFANQMQCKPEMVQALIDSGASVEAAYEQIGDDATARQVTAKELLLAQLNTNPNASAGGPIDGKSEADEALTPEDRYKKEFAASKDLQAEFATVGQYIAWRTFEVEGRIRLVGAKG